MTPTVLRASIFVAVDQVHGLWRPLSRQVSAAVVALAELELGVLMARDPDAVPVSRRSPAYVEQTTGLAADERVASAYARLVAGRACRRARTTSQSGVAQPQE
jgi:hypothetical protein